MSQTRATTVATIVGTVFVLLIGAYFGLQRVDRQLDSNAIGTGSPIATITPDQTLCVNTVYVPEGTERLNTWLGAPKGPTTADLTFISKDGEVATKRDIPIPVNDYQFIPTPQPSWNIADTQRICMTTNNELQVGGAWIDRLPGEKAATIDGKSLGESEPTLHYYSGADDRPIALTMWPKIFERSQYFHGPLFPWLMLLTFLLALGATVWGLRTLARAPEVSVKKIAVIFTLATFAWGAAWSVMSPAFQGNDESEHFANLQHIAETGHVTDISYGSKLPSYSTREHALMNGMHHRGLVVDEEARPFWNQRRVDDWERADEKAASDNGGGYTIAASGHSGLYYALFAPVYKLTTWMKPANQIVVLRVVNAGAGAFVAFFAVLIAALLFGDGRRRAIACAGALIAFQPQFAYINSSINNDTFVNLSGAAMLYLLVAIATLGWSVRREILVGVLAVLGPVAKLTATAASLFAAGSVLFLIARDRSMRAVRGGATVLASLIATAVVWLTVLGWLGWPRTLTNHHINEPPSPPEWTPTLVERLDYMIQTVFPFIHITGPMQQVTQPLGRIYVVGGFADFFWHRVAYGESVYKVIGVFLFAVFCVGVWGIWKHRRQVREIWLQFLMVVLYPVVVAGLVAWAYATPGGRNPLAEQGRYIFPAITALAVITAGCAYGLRERLRPWLWGGLAGLFVGFAVVGYTFASFHVYS